MASVSKYDDVIDSEGVRARIAELRDEWAEVTGDDPDDYELSVDDWAVGLGEAGAEEMVALLELDRDGRLAADDWDYGVALISDYYFPTYAIELAADLYGLDAASWPYTHIDWEAAAEELKGDYTNVEFDGVTFWVQ